MIQLLVAYSAQVRYQTGTPSATSDGYGLGGDVTVGCAAQSAESGRQALSASQVPQWSQVQVPEGLPQAPELGNVLGTSGVNPLLLLGAVAAIAVPAVLYQVFIGGTCPSRCSGVDVLLLPCICGLL